ncbi:MAG: STN domain-containing protein [Butyricimonas faecihominis]
MKTWFVLLFVCTMHLSASNLYSQQKKMDISMKNASLVDVFRYIRQNSDYTFVYDSDAVKQMKTVSLDMKNVAIEEILEQCFKGSPFAYLIEESSDYQGAERRATASEECS